MIAIDTEDDSRGTPNLFAAVSDDGSYYTRSRLDFLLYLSQQRGDVWATNLEYDLVNVFGDSIPEVGLRFSRNALISAKWKGLRFLDTVRHVPASVKALGEWTDLPKMERDGSPEYCVRDAAITRRGALEVCRLYRELGLERPAGTLASSALRLWRQRWSRSGELRLPQDRVLGIAERAYYGGRTEVFHAGEFRNVAGTDMASAYPWAMTHGPFPIPWGLYRESRTLRRLGFYRVKVSLPRAAPFGTLPYRSADGNVYPRGSWEGYYTGLELEAHLAHGGTILQVVEGVTFPFTCLPFGKYIADLFRVKHTSRGLRRTHAKLLLNGLYGKFGERGGRTVAVPQAVWEDMKPRPRDTRLGLGLALYTLDTPPPPWGNVVWAALVTARCRVRLLAELHHLREAGCTPLYCDTDGIYYLGGFRYPQKAANVGGWEDRGHYSRMTIRGKKEYGIKRAGEPWTWYAKGVPFAAREEYVRNGVASFVRPNRLRESLRLGKAPNVWEDREKRRKRVLDPGPVPPYTLRES